MNEAIPSMNGDVADEVNFVRNVVFRFSQLAYLHNFFPSLVDRQGKAVATVKAIGHGDFDVAIRAWIGQVCSLIVKRYRIMGRITDKTSIEALTAQVETLKHRAHQQEQQNLNLKEYCFLDQANLNCTTCQYVANCINKYLEEHSVYEYFIKSFDFKKVFSNAIFIERNETIISNPIF